MRMAGQSFAAFSLWFEIFVNPAPVLAQHNVMLALAGFRCSLSQDTLAYVYNSAICFFSADCRLNEAEMFASQRGETN